MRPKEAGYVLSIDQASNQAGVSLWYDGELMGHAVLYSQATTDPYARRLQHQVPQLTDFLNKQLPRGVDIDKVLFEGMKNRLVLITVGAFLTCPRINAKLHQKFSFVESPSWKKWAKTQGATGFTKDVKGVKALSEIGYPVTACHITSDDVADSILMYLTWRSKP